MARVILEIDLEREPQRARISTASHLRRAEWMAEKGFREMLRHRE
jgi:hypothetical protein